MIRLQDVTKVYEGGTVAVRDANLDVPKGEFVFLVGPSGSGKSTLIRLMLRQDDVTRGSIWVAGKDVTRMPSWKVPFLRRSMGTVFQDFKLLPNKTVAENVAFALEVLGRPRTVIRRQVTQVLDLVGLDGKADRKPKQLSGGEQQRVSIARAFVNRPPIMLADEPTGNLDPATSVGIMRLLDRINRTGTTIVMATHDHAIVDAMRRRVVQLEAGRIVRDQSSGRYEHIQGSPPEQHEVDNGEEQAIVAERLVVEPGSEDDPNAPVADLIQGTDEPDSDSIDVPEADEAEGAESDS